MDLEAIRTLCDQIRSEVRKTVVGQDEVMDLLLTALMCGGHVLLEGVPGTAKTLLCRSFAASLSLEFGRIQFTPDLMPGDVLGTSLFDFRTNEFQLRKGPIFTDILLADEINRTPPKTQAAMLQVMNEKIVTIDGTDFPMGESFMVVATQNPIEQQGTYPLPEAQLDRFMFKLTVGYPTEEEEFEIVRRHGHEPIVGKGLEEEIRPVAEADSLRGVRRTIESVRINDDILKYIVDIARATRETPSISFGVSARASTALATAARSYATLKGRDYVIPDDVKYLCLPTLRHRVVLSPSAEIAGQSADNILSDLIAQVPAPR